MLTRKLHWILLQPTTLFEYKYSRTSGFDVEYKHEYCSFSLSPLAVKRDIAVTILLRCMCVRVCKEREKEERKDR